MLVRQIETVRFARSLGALIEGGVPLPNALALARRTVGNGHMNAAIGEVADIVRQGGGLAERRVVAEITGNPRQPYVLRWGA